MGRGQAGLPGGQEPGGSVSRVGPRAGQEPGGSPGWACGAPPQLSPRCSYRQCPSCPQTRPYLLPALLRPTLLTHRTRHRSNQVRCLNVPLPSQVEAPRGPSLLALPCRQHGAWRTAGRSICWVTQMSRTHGATPGSGNGGRSSPNNSSGPRRADHTLGPQWRERQWGRGGAGHVQGTPTPPQGGRLPGDLKDQRSGPRHLGKKSDFLSNARVSEAGRGTSLAREPSFYLPSLY